MKLLTYTLTLMLAAGVLATSCKKEIVSEKSNLVTEGSSQVTAIKPGNAATHEGYTASYDLNYTSFNPCTGEDVMVTGSVKYRVTWIRTGNKLHYNYHFGYDQVKGVGLTTGTRYNCSGHINQSMQATVVGTEPNVRYEIANDNVTNRIKMTAPSGRSLISRANYKMVVKDGVLVVNHSRYEWDVCK